jgi:excisionase family DNA binding protein
MISASHKQPAEATPDLIEELRREFDAVVSWAVAEFAQRDAREAAMLARIAALEAASAGTADLDGRTNIKRAAKKLGCSDEKVRRWCVSGRIDAAKDRGRWRVRIS